MSDFVELHPPDDHSLRSFIWHEWIQANGYLTAENVFDYFMTSMYYDKQSSNQTFRMQTEHTGVPVSSLNEAEELKRFTGIEFALVHAQEPTFFIIQKRNRTSPVAATVLANYFIMNNKIFQAPDLYSLLSNRLLTSVSALQASLDTLRSNRPDYTPRTGFVWPIVEPPSTDPLKAKVPSLSSTNPSLDPDPELSKKETEKKKPAEAPKKQTNSRLLELAMQTTAAHSRMSFTSAAVAPTETVEGPGAGVSATPGPSGAPTPKAAATPTPAQEAPATTKGVAGAAGAGKKKKKRMSIAPNAMQQ